MGIFSAAIPRVGPAFRGQYDVPCRIEPALTTGLSSRRMSETLVITVYATGVGYEVWPLHLFDEP